MNNNKIKFAFWGTPEVASKTLQILESLGLTPEIIITNPDKKSGRGLQIHSSPVKTLGQELGIKILTPEKIDTDFINELKQFDLDINIVVAYGKILPEEIINMPKNGTVNIHYSLLPKYRGASPLESALLNGDKETGVSIQKMVKKLDAGDVIAESKVEIDINISKNDLREILIDEGARLLHKILPDYIDNKIEPKPQDESLATHCGKITKEDGEIDPNGNARDNYNKYRAFAGWPGIYFFKDGKRIKVTSAHLDGERFVIDRIIPEGKKETDYVNNKK